MAPMLTVTLSQFARGLSAETAFDVLAVARRLKAAGQGRHRTANRRQPVSQHAHALAAGIQAIDDGATHYCPSLGLPASAKPSPRNYQPRIRHRRSTAENVVVGPGAKVFEQFFCEAFLDPGDAVLVFSRISRPTARTSSAAAAASSSARCGRRTSSGPI